MSNTLPPLPKPTLEAHEYEIWGRNVNGDFYTTEPLMERIAELERLRSEDHAHAIDMAVEIELLKRQLEEARKQMGAQIGQGVLDSVLNALDNFEKKERSPFQTYLVAGLVTGLVDELRAALLASVPAAPQIKPCPLCKSQHGPQICGTPVDIALTTQTQAVPAPQQKSLTDEQIVAAYCKERRMRHYVEAYVAGARFAESAHNIGEKK